MALAGSVVVGGGGRHFGNACLHPNRQ